MIEPVIVDLLRHGEVAADDWAFRGSTDVALSETGWQQMQAVGQQLSSAAIDSCATSPMQRCQRFAQELVNQHACPLQIVEDMREMDFGDWEGCDFKAIEAFDQQRLHRFWQSPLGVQPPGGECFNDFAERVITAWHEWLQEACGGHRILVAHGGVIRVILAHTLDMPMEALWRLHLPYASWSRISLLQGHAPRLMFMNHPA